MRRTRPPAGARLVLWLALAAWAGAAAAAPPESGPPPWRVGGRVGFTVDAALFPDSAGTTLDVYVRVPPATLAALERDSTGQGRLRLTTRLRGSGRMGRQEQAQEYAIQPLNTTAGFGRVVGMRFPVSAGVLRLNVRLEDALSRKVGLVYAGRQITEAGSVEGTVRVASRNQELDLSGLEFVWAATEAPAGTSFERGGRTLLPNPERLYGLFAPRVQASFTGAAATPGPWLWTARVLGDQGRTLMEARDSAAAPARRLDGVVGFGVGKLPAGGYDLEVEVRHGDAAPQVRRERFSVAWQIGSWLRNPRDVQDDVHFLLPPDREEDFAMLPPGEQERILAGFWLERDPTPGTPENEARRMFQDRVEHANQTWSHPGLGKGMFSDMGRVYVRYGEPSEVMNQVIPTGDETVDLAITQIQSNETRSIGGVDDRGPAADQRPYEMWIYDPPVTAPFDADPKVAQRVRQKRLVFLFVDERGMGDYRLRYSTE